MTEIILYIVCCISLIINIMMFMIYCVKTDDHPNIKEIYPGVYYTGVRHVFFREIEARLRHGYTIEKATIYQGSGDFIHASVDLDGDQGTYAQINCETKDRRLYDDISYINEHRDSNKQLIRYLG